MAPQSQDLYRGGEGGPFGGHVARLVAVQPAVERLLRVASVALFDEQAREMQSRGRCGPGGGFSELPARQSCAFLEAVADFPEARLPAGEHRGEV